MSDDVTYIVGIDDLFRVKNADSPEEAVEMALERFGNEGWRATDATVVDVED